MLTALLFAVAVDTTSDPAMIEVFREMKRLALSRPDLEVAAFLVRDDDGGISCRLWPSSFVSAARYDGSMPKGTFALIHTHPSRSPMPSRGDLEEAKRVGLPIYVLTPSQLSVVDANGTTTRLPLRLPRSSQERCKCVEERPMALFTSRR